MSRLSALLLWVAALLLPLPALAHKPSDAYLSLTVEGARIQGQWDIALRDLEHAVGIDTNGDGAITWGELRARHMPLAAHALGHLVLRMGGGECPARAQELLVDRHSDGAYAVFRFVADCARAGDVVGIDYRLFFDVDPQHRGLASISRSASVHTAILSADRPVASVALGTPSRWRQLREFVVQGVWHIWIGFDHILFLVTLLLPAVLNRTAGRWQPVPTFREALLGVVRVVTAFTVAHSLTLGLAVLGLVSLPSRLVESAIAASVVLVALNNLCPVVTRHGWRLAMAFGLVHGLGFAAVLQDLGLPDGALLLSLLGFNIGVELGQLAIVGVLLPVIFGLRHRAVYRVGVLGAGSLASAAVATVWLAERSLNVRLPVF